VIVYRERWGAIEAITGIKTMKLTMEWNNKLLYICKNKSKAKRLKSRAINTLA